MQSHQGFAVHPKKSHSQALLNVRDVLTLAEQSATLFAVSRPAEFAQIESIAEDVYRKLGSGFSESVYDRAMQVGLRLAGIRYESQKVVELTYRNHCVGEGYPDLVIQLGREKVIIELKAVSGELGAPEERQLRNYMEILGVRHGILINFQQPGKKTGKTRLELRAVP